MELRERILDAAAQVYSETGFRGATTRLIAERAGVNEITLFRHFGSKERLLREAVICASTGSTDPTRHFPANPEAPAEDIRQWARSVFQTLYEQRGLIRKAIGEVEEHPELLPVDQTHAACAQRALEGYLESLRQADRITADVDLQASVKLLLGAIFAEAMTGDLFPDQHRPSPDQTIDQFVTLFLRALGIKETET